MSRMIERLLRSWCWYFHTDIYAPVNGQYICRNCQRQWQVPWEQNGFTSHELPEPNRDGAREPSGALAAPGSAAG